MIAESTGFLGDIKGIASTGVRAVRSRLELLAIELKEEKAWLVRSVVIAVASLYLLSFGFMLGIFALVLFAAEENRPAILAICALLFVGAGIAGALYLKSASSKRNSIFEDTIKVLKGDESGLQQALRGTGD